MRFIIYTSLTSLILLIFYFLIIKRVYKRIKPGIDATLNVVDSAATAIGSCSKEFLDSVNGELIEFDSKLIIDNFNTMLENNDNNIEHLYSIVKDKQKREEIKKKSITKLHEKYKESSRDLKKNKLLALKSQNHNLIDTIDEFENDLDVCYKEILGLEEFVMADFVVDELSKEYYKS